MENEKALVITEEVVFDEDIITLVVRDHNDEELILHSRFKIRKTEEIKKAYAAFIGEKNPENFRLLINGRRIQDEQTPQILGIESGNVITVESTGRITITIQDQNSNEAKFNVKKSSKIAKLKQAFASKIGETNVSELRLVFDGRRVDDNQTPASYDMKDGDVIEVFREMTGGTQQISTRSFGEIPKGLGDTVVGALRRSLRRMRDWSMQKSQPKVEFIELSPMSTAPITPQV